MYVVDVVDVVVDVDVVACIPGGAWGDTYCNVAFTPLSLASHSYSSRLQDIFPTSRILQQQKTTFTAPVVFRQRRKG